MNDLCRICHAEVGLTERAVIFRSDELYHALCFLARKQRGTWMDHADDCPAGAECNCDHPRLLVSQAMAWGNE